jgi:hypothetical protein
MTPERELLELLNVVPEEEVDCRAGHHRFAIDHLPPARLANRINVRPALEGCYRVEDLCMGGCGVVLVVTTMRGGYLDAFADRRMLYPPEWVRVPRGYPHGKRTFRGEKYRRSAEEYAAVIKSLAARAAQSAQPAPAVRFASGPA